MNSAERQTRSQLMELFELHGFHPRSNLGQNFLIDLNLLEYIVEEAQLGPQDVVLEVGTGTGGLTACLAQQAGAVVSVEIDSNMHRLAAQAVSAYDNVTLLRADVLKNKNRFSAELLDTLAATLEAEPGRRLKLVSNLPYSVATPVVSNLVASDLDWERMVVTIQLELGQKMTARPGTEQYGALSVWMQSQTHVKLLKRLRPTVFWPRPGVFSAIVRVHPDPARRSAILDRRFFQDFLRRLFQQRRKLLRTAAAGMYRKQLKKPQVDSILDELELTGRIRAETLDGRKLVKLANRLCEEVRNVERRNMFVEVKSRR